MSCAHLDARVIDGVSSMGTSLVLGSTLSRGEVGRAVTATVMRVKILLRYMVCCYLIL